LPDPLTVSLHAHQQGQQGQQEGAFNTPVRRANSK
jgi:hypothetical protein